MCHVPGFKPAGYILGKKVANLAAFYHSVTLDEEKCKGCTHCIKRCPTEAIRVRDGKARIITERCTDCGECIRLCPHHAKRAVYDDVSRLKDFKYNIALPPPTLYGQFNNLDDIDYVLSGLIGMGFDDVFEVSKCAEIISDATRKLFKDGLISRPVINSACPAVVRMIKVKFPELCDNVLPMVAPMHLAAKMAKEEAHEKTGLPFEDIGAFFITPCPAKVTDARQPLGIEKSWVDGTLALSELYPKLVDCMNKVKTPMSLVKSGIIGVSWASSGGEASALIREKHLAADGMENVMSVLEELEDERLGELDFIELNACPGGCVGGVLTVENPYVAKARVQRLRKYLPVSLNRLEDEPGTVLWKLPLEHIGSMKLSNDIGEAMRMMAQIDDICEGLPSLDCGSCGAPSCRALAEDIVTGKARLNDCVFVLREEASSAGINVSHHLRTDAE